MPRSARNQPLDRELDDIDDRHFQNLVDEVNELVALHSPAPPRTVRVPSRRSFAPPPAIPDPELWQLSTTDTVLRVVSEFCPGDVLLIGSKEKGCPEAKPYTALAVAADRSETVSRAVVIFEAITAAGGVPYWKLNPYSREAVAKHSGVFIDERWNGKKLVAKLGTWVDDHIARIGFLSGDHDVGRTPEETSDWEKLIPHDEALAQYWFKIQYLATGPIPTLLQHSGRGFSPIWQIHPPVVHTAQSHADLKKVLAHLLERARDLAADPSIYSSVNPFIKAPGAVHPITGRAASYAVVDESRIYPLDEFETYFATYRPWIVDWRPPREYPDDPVRRKQRKTTDASRAAYKRRLGPSYAFVADLYRLLDYWNDDLTGRSNAFFRSFAWHRRNILWTEVGVEAARRKEQLSDHDYAARVYSQLREEMDDLNVRTGERIDSAKMDGYVAADFPPKPKPCRVWARELGVTPALARELDLTTILPEDERRQRDEAAAIGKARRETARDLKNKELDEMILSGQPYDYSIYTKEQVKHRARKLEAAGVKVPERKKGRRRKKVEDSPID